MQKSFKELRCSRLVKTPTQKKKNIKINKQTTKEVNQTKKQHFPGGAFFFFFCLRCCMKVLTLCHSSR